MFIGRTRLKSGLRNLIIESCHESTSLTVKAEIGPKGFSKRLPTVRPSTVQEMIAIVGLQS